MQIFKFVVLLPLLVVGANGQAKIVTPSNETLIAQPRIINGYQATKGRNPYMASLKKTRGKRDNYCGATLIAPSLLLSAAHCYFNFFEVVVNPFSIEVVPDDLPQPNRTIFQVNATFVHPLYNKAASWDYDLMLIKINGVSDEQWIKLNNDPQIPKVNDKLSVLGWGTTAYGIYAPPPGDVIQQADDAIVVSNQACQTSYVGLGAEITSNMLCCVDERACQGDSGGPLMYKGSSAVGDLQVGIVSFGIGCNEKKYPGIYSRVSSGWDWIRKTACEVSPPGEFGTPAYFECPGTTNSPSVSPTDQPSRSPSVSPTTLPPSPRPTNRPSSSPTLSPVPTHSPTPNPSSAPSLSHSPTLDQQGVLLRIFTDYWSGEVGWSLKSSDGVTVNSARLTAAQRTQNVDFNMVLFGGETYTLTLTDSGRDGICCRYGNGTVSVYLGDKPEYLTLLAFSDGSYGASTTLVFRVAESAIIGTLKPTFPPTKSPAPSNSPIMALSESPTNPVPSSSPTERRGCPLIPEGGCAVCGNDKCVTNPNFFFEYPGVPLLTCGQIETAGAKGLITENQCVGLLLLEQFQTDCACADRTPVPSSQPSISPAPSPVPTITAAPTAAPSDPPGELFTVVIYTDAYPSETGWSVQSVGRSLVKRVIFGEYSDETDAGLIIKTKIRLEMGTQYIFSLYDLAGDGICCRYGNGRAEIYHGTVTAPKFLLVNINDSFTQSVVVNFIAQDPVVDGPGRVDTPVVQPKPPSFICFPGDTTCQVEGKGKVLMKNIKLGDRVLVANDKYETVYSFGHHSPFASAEYVQLTTPIATLELSKDHMVFVDGGRAVPASNVRVGDKLESVFGSPSVVTEVRMVIRKGAYAPFTISGTLIVNGVKSSSFVAFQDSSTLKIAGMDSRVGYQWLAHTFETPHRLWCMYFSPCVEEQYTSDGISLWVDYPHRVGRWYLDQSPIITLSLAVPIMALYFWLGYPATFICITLSVILARKARTLSCRLRLK